jgi:hypothetical protein
MFEKLNRIALVVPCLNGIQVGIPDKFYNYSWSTLSQDEIDRLEGLLAGCDCIGPRTLKALIELIQQ